MTASAVTRLARLAIELSGAPADPRSLAALDAAETVTLPPGAEELAVAATAAVEDAPHRAAADAALACERALSARLRPEEGAAYVRGTADDVVDCARRAYLRRERSAGRDGTAEGIAAAEGEALAAVRAILPTYGAAALWAEVSALSVADAGVLYVALRDRRARLYATAHRRPTRGPGTHDATVRAEAEEVAAATAELAATELRAHLLSRRGAGLGLHPAGCSLCTP